MWAKIWARGVINDGVGRPASRAINFSTYGVKYPLYRLCSSLIFQSSPVITPRHRGEPGAARSFARGVDVHDGHVEDLQHGIVRWEMSLCLGDFAELEVQAQTSSSRRKISVETHAA